MSPEPSHSSTALLATPSIADRVIARAQKRRRPLMPDDEAIIRSLCDGFVEKQKAEGAWPPALGEEHVVEFLTAAVGNLEFDIPKDGGFKLALHAPDPSLLPEAPDAK